MKFVALTLGLFLTALPNLQAKKHGIPGGTKLPHHTTCQCITWPCHCAMPAVERLEPLKDGMKKKKHKKKKK